MKNFLSIGEVARLKRITVKALRYYEKIGIFSPAYINEETGYRYYKVEQMVPLDFILTCVDLGIPLKRYSSYLNENGTLDIDRILCDGTQMAEKEIARINRTAEKLRNMSRHLEESEQLPEDGTAHDSIFPERYLLLEPMETLSPTQKQYISAMTELYFRMEGGQYTNLYKQGLIYFRKDGALSCFVFNAIERPACMDDVCVLPSGEGSLCCFDRVNGERWLHCVEPYIREGAGGCLLLQERYERHLAKEPFWEMQIMPEIRAVFPVPQYQVNG